MCKTFETISLMFMWFAFSSVFLTNAFETYSETDQLAEESIGGYDKKGHQETTTNTNLISSKKESNIPNEEQSVKSVSSETEPIDPLQKILPKVKFNCKGKSEGYYADNEFCEVFHYCKTNGFRFTFMCPPESYYNDKLMACEFNSTLSKCVERDNKTQNKGLNIIKETSIKTSIGQTVDVLQKSSSQIDTNTEKSETVTTTTTESTKVVADPYLTKRRVHYGPRTKSNIMADKNKAQNNTQYISQGNRSQNQTTMNETNENITETILPFNGFRKFIRNKNQMKNKTSIITNDVKNIDNSTNDTNISSDQTVRIPSNALPVLKSIRPQLLSNSNQLKNYKNRSRTKTATNTTSSTTTTPHPSLLGPTVRESTTESPFDYFTPIFDSGTNFPLSSDFFPLSMHKKPENIDKTNQRKSFMTQNFFNSIRHSTQRPNPEKESQIEETLKQSETNSESNSEFLPKTLSDGLTPLPPHNYNRSPLFSGQQQKHFNPDVDSEPSESQIQELIEKLKQMDSNQQLPTDFHKSDYSEGETLMEPIEDINENAHIGRRKRREKNKPKQFLTVPLLVPTGVSKSDLRRKLSSTLLKPTVLPLTESGEQIPAYVLQFQESERSRKTKNNKHRNKRQTFNWNPFQPNPFLTNNYYLPMNSMSSPVYSHFHNQMRPTLPMNSYRSRHLDIGDRRFGFGLNPSAQRPIPYYIPPKKQFIPNNFIGNNYFRDNGIYDLSEFSDYYENPFTKRPVPFMANDMSPYRAVTLKKPGFKRPPRRQKIPETKNNNNTTPNTETKTTVRPFNSVPVSPRPYSQPIVRQQFYARNSNPFSDFSDMNLNEAIKVFDNSDDHLQSLDPDFGSHSLFNFNSPQSFSNDFIPIIPKTQSFAETLNGRSSRINTFAETPQHFSSNNYVPDFPPLPNFGDPAYRLPFVDIPDPTLTNLGHRSNSENSSNKLFVQQNHDNSTRYSTPYTPELNLNLNTNTKNQTERNPNHNYDNVGKGELHTATTLDTKHNLRPILIPTINWDNIVGQYHKQNVSVTKPQISVNESVSKDQKESEISKNQSYVTYGIRLKANTNKYSQNPEISVKTSVSSVSSVSSLQPEASNQVMISRKFGTSDELLSSETVKSETDNKQKSIDELYNQRAFDRLMLFNYYNHLNRQKLKTSSPTTTTVSPLDGKYPSTSHWSIRGWTGQYYAFPSKTSTTTAAPVITKNSNIEYLDLFESETKINETITELPETTTTDIPEPPYKRVFNSQLGATFHSNKYSKPFSFSEKTRSDISDYLSSLTTTTLKTI